MQQYVPCFGQQVKDHNASDTTDIMSNPQTVTEYFVGQKTAIMCQFASSI